jgi:hypothetical protein
MRSEFVAQLSSGSLAAERGRELVLHRYESTHLLWASPDLFRIAFEMPACRTAGIEQNRGSPTESV